MNIDELTRSLKAYALSEGADLVGIANVERYDGAPEKLKPQAHLPEARSVISMAVHHLDASIDFGAEPNSNYPAGFQIGMIETLDMLAGRITMFLERKGYRAVPYSCTHYWRHRKCDGVEFDMAASFSNMNSFVAAGLGEYGWHGMVMSPQYGPRQRTISVITDAPLTPDPLYRDEPLCDRCNQCEKACWGDNYKPNALLTPKTIRFTIEDKQIEYANINRWRCFWGEQCHLDMRTLAQRNELDEAGIYEAIESGVPRIVEGRAGYMCSSLKYCMSKPVRIWNRKLAPNPLRRKKTPSLQWSDIRNRILFHAKHSDASCISIQHMEDFADIARTNAYEGFRIDDFLQRFQWVVAFGDVIPEVYHQAQNDGGVMAKLNAAAYSSRTVIAAYDICKWLDDEGYSVMQLGVLFDIHQQAAQRAGWGPDVDPQVFVTDAPLEEFTAGVNEIGSENNDAVSLDNPLLEHVHLVGSTPLDRLAEKDRANLRLLLPEAQSLIALAIEMPQRVVELAGRQETDCGVSYTFCSYQMQREVFWTARDLAFAIERKGYKALPLLYPDPNFEGVYNHYAVRIADPRAVARFAEAAGLGFVGKGGFLISKEYGPRLRFAFVLTNRKLPASPRTEGACPEGCHACAEACPIGALTPDAGKRFDFDTKKCRWAHEIGMVKGEGTELGGQWRQPDLPVPDTLDEKAIEQAFTKKDPIQTICYENPRRGETPIERCIQACPFTSARGR